LFKVCGVLAIQPATVRLLQNRIVGGQEAIPNSFPWQVFIRGNNVFCGASLIDDNWIVTAAHCALP
jgi:secreted trypsin-like serine protease